MLAWTYVGMKLGPGKDQFMTTPDTLENWSEHQFKCGVVHVDYLKTLADENGNIHVSKLPEQQIERHPPRRGEDHWLNPTGKWVPKGTPREEELRAPDMSAYTPTEQADVLEQMARMGKFTPDVVEQLAAQGLIRPSALAPEAFRMPDPVIDTSALKNKPSAEKAAPKKAAKRPAKKAAPKKAAKKAAPKKK
jgi:hypothetical protein